jgi:hypothetical protein
MIQTTTTGEGPRIEIPQGTTQTWEFTIQDNFINPNFKNKVSIKQDEIGFQVWCEAEYQHATRPTNTPTLPPPPSGTTYTPTLTPTPFLNCPICPDSYYYTDAYHKCCLNSDTQCHESKPAQFENCKSGVQCIKAEGCDGDGSYTTLTNISEGLPEETDKEKTEKQNCKDCVSGEKFGNNITGAYTALGCMPTDLSTFFQRYLFVTGLGFAGGIAFLLILWGGFTIIISQGDPKKIEQGREIIISALIGLLFIIFAVVILQVIGGNILGLPGFGENK